VARQVKFFRTKNSLLNSTPGESIGTADGVGSNAAEVINYTPEMYLAPSPLKNADTVDAGTFDPKYDAIFTLPPIF